jgi:hypothetical protein
MYRKAKRLQHIIERDRYNASIEDMQAPSERVSDLDAQDHNIQAPLSSLQRPEASAVLRQMLKYNPLHAQVLETLWAAENASLAECVKPLVGLASSKPYQAWYPDPVLPPLDSGCCPYCYETLSNGRKPWSHSRRAEHVLNCHQIVHSVTFCLQCAMFVDNRLIGGHMCLDLDLERNGIYGVLSWRKLIISEGRCPYGAGLACGKRRFTDPQRLKTHIEGMHVKKRAEGHQICPVRDCKVEAKSKDDLRAHLQKRHYI